MEIFYGDKRWYYPVKTMGKTNFSEVFVCRGMGEEQDETYTVNRLKDQVAIAYCIHYYHSFCTGFLESFFQEGDLFLVFSHYHGMDLGVFVKKYPNMLLQVMESTAKKIITVSLPRPLLGQIVEEDCLCIEEDGTVHCNYYFRFPLCWMDMTEQDVIEKTKNTFCAFFEITKSPTNYLQNFNMRKLKTRLGQSHESLIILYMDIRDFLQGYKPKSIKDIKEEYVAIVKEKIDKAKYIVAAVVAVAGVIIMYYNWIMGHFGK